MKQTFDKVYDLYIVKRNDGKDIRLANFNDALGYVREGMKWTQDWPRTEVLFKDCGDDCKNPLLQTHRQIWWQPGNPIITEATFLNQAAMDEHNDVVAVIDQIPDVDPMAKTKESAGTLIISEGEKYKIVDGVGRNK